MKLPCFTYTDEALCAIVHEIDLPGWEERLVVVGMDGYGCYEWIWCRGACIVEHSDDGWGDAATCLREGLNRAIPKEPNDDESLSQVANSWTSQAKPAAEGTE